MNKWNEFIKILNTKGIPIPTIRDPKTQQGSISLTLVFISFNLFVLSVIGKYAAIFGGIDTNQSLNLFYACAALYWGRKFQNGNVSINDEQNNISTSTVATKPTPQKVDSPE